MSSSRGERLRHTLAFRLALWYAAVFLASALMLVGLTYVLLASALERRDREVVLSTLREYVARYDAGGLGGLEAAVRSDRLTGTREHLFVRVLGRRAQAVFLSMPADWSKFDLGALGGVPEGGRVVWHEVPSADRTASLEVAGVRLAEGTLFQVGKSTELRDELLDRFRSVILIVFLSIVVVGLAGGALVTRSGLAPIRHLVATIRSIVRTGRLHGRVPVRGTGDVLDELSGLVNTMLDRIDALIAGMRGALDNVAHDLRTPMTRLRGLAEQALAGPNDAAAYRDALADCVEESERVIAVLNTLMDISEAETGTMRLHLEPVDLGRLVRDAVELYADVADEKAIELAVMLPPSLTAHADAARMRQVIANLLDNAIKYTPSRGRVSVEGGRADHGHVTVAVTDTGPGIRPEDVARIWDRLYRADESRTERGLGLGLSLVKAVVEAHGGQARVESAPGRGSTFTVRLPAGEHPGIPFTDVMEP